MLWYGVALLEQGTLAPSISTLALLEDVEVVVGANAQTIMSAAVWGLLVGFSLVAAGVTGIVGVRR